MADTDLCFMPATLAAARIAQKELSPLELMDAVLTRAEALNPTLNALCVEDFDAARDAARKAEAAVAAGERLGPLHGIPVTIKDLTTMKGLPFVAGSKLFKGRVGQADAPLVERLRSAGAIVIGKTTSPEAGWKGCGDSPAHGATHNPWRHGFNPGGSSGGAGACAAAGIGLLHQGSDGAGSIRMPAAFCGVFGIKPTFGRVPNWPISNLHQMTHNGPLTRTVADSALMLQVMAGAHPADMMTLDSPPEDYRATIEDGIKGLKIGYSRNLGYLKVDPEVAEAVEAAIPAFREAGAIVEEVDRLWPEDPFEPMERVLWASGIGGRVGRYLERQADLMDPGLVACAIEGLSYSTREIMDAWDRRIALFDAQRAFFERYDLLVTPSLSVAAFPVNRLIPEHWEQHEWDWIRWAGFSYPFNLTWNPAASVPCGFTPDKLPVGLQIVAPRFADGLVFRAARAFETVRPWAGERPPL